MGPPDPATLDDQGRKWNIKRRLITGIIAAATIPLFLQFLGSAVGGAGLIDKLYGQPSGPGLWFLFVGLCLVAAVYSGRFLSQISKKLIEEAVNNAKEAKAKVDTVEQKAEEASQKAAAVEKKADDAQEKADNAEADAKQVQKSVVAKVAAVEKRVEDANKEASTAKQTLQNLEVAVGESVRETNLTVENLERMVAKVAMKDPQLQPEPAEFELLKLLISPTIPSSQPKTGIGMDIAIEPERALKKIEDLIAKSLREKVSTGDPQDILEVLDQMEEKGLINFRIDKKDGAKLIQPGPLGRFLLDKDLDL